MKITLKLWILIIFLVLSMISIFSFPPLFLQKGVLVNSVDSNSKIFEDGLRKGMIITSINNKNIESSSDFFLQINEYSSLKENETKKFILSTSDGFEIVNLYNRSLPSDFEVSDIPPTRIKTGLDLRGGARALVRADVELTDSELNDLISVSEQRLNVYGLSDVKFFKVISSNQERLMGVEIAGSSPQDLEELISKQGKFEAKIGNETVFIGGNKDVTFVGRSGTDAYISECFAVKGGEACNFRFSISLSEEAAKRHAGITGNLSLNGSYLSKTLDLYVDDKLISSLNIGSSLKGSIATQIQISGSGSGANRQEAIDSAKLEMKKLQTILITGSLPFKLEIVKLDRVSPNLGEEFGKTIIEAGIYAVIAVSILVFLRYRKIKLSLTILLISFSEIIIILGVAALIHWNLDLPSIAGIIATIGTGIDSQIIILDESRDKRDSLKNQIKRALFIIVTAFATAFISLIPLTGLLGFMGIGAASAGLLKGFAVTTLIGITAGILITRPAFADIIGQIESK